MERGCSWKNNVRCLICWEESDCERLVRVGLEDVCDCDCTLALVEDCLTIMGSGDFDGEARLSRSSMRILSFLPGRTHMLVTCRAKRHGVVKQSEEENKEEERSFKLTIVSLSNAVLDSTALGKVGYLGPIFVRVRHGTECTAAG